MADMHWLNKALAEIRRHPDICALALLLAATGAYAAWAVDFARPPFEDAAMLMRYVEHVAGGQGIVWNVNEPPVDGATDFLFMVSAAGLTNLGISTGRAVRTLGLGAHILTVVLVYAANRKLWNAGTAVALITGLYLAFGTGLWYVAAYFGTPFFALFASMSWCLALLLIQAESPGDVPILGFAVSALLTALIRPEGALLSILMLISIVILRGWRRSLRIVGLVTAVMLLGGGSYFAWHWSYFGHPLPNPYYKKGGGLLHWDSFWESLSYLVRFSGPFALAFVLGLRSRQTMRLVLAFAVTLLGFAALFVLVSNETNYGGRFQYALFPMVLLCFYPLVSGLRREVRIQLRPARNWLNSLARVLTFLALVYGLLSYASGLACQLTSQQQTCGVPYEADGRYDVARTLGCLQRTRIRTGH